jgi:hypothetical protein
MAHVFQKQVEEISWLTQQLYQEAENLLVSDHPYVHLFLMNNLANTTTKRSMQLQQALQEKMQEIGHYSDTDEILNEEDLERRSAC